MTEQTADNTDTTAAFTVYFADWCPFCQRLLKGLDDEGVAYDRVDVETDAEASAWVESVNDGNRVVPTLKFWDGTTMTNPPVKKVLRKLKEREEA